MQRWILAVQEFTFTTIHIPGKTNVVAGALSRFPPLSSCIENDGQADLEILYEHLLLQDIDYEPWLCEIYGYLNSFQDGSLGRNVSSFGFEDGSRISKIRTKSLNYKVHNEKLFKRIGQRYVMIPFIDERTSILTMIHDGHGHFRQHASWARLFKDYWWPSSFKDLKEYIATCTECQMCARVSKFPALENIPVLRLFEQLSIDFVGTFPPSSKGNRYILVAVENFTRWPIAQAVANADADTVADFLYSQVFSVFGPFTFILSDNVSHFSNDIVEKFLALV